MKPQSIDKSYSDYYRRLVRTGWKGWLILYGSWTIPPIMITSGYAMLLPSDIMGNSWLSIFLIYAWVYYYFAILCPGIYRMIGIITFTKRNWFFVSLFYLMLGLGIAVFALFIGEFVNGLCYSISISPAEIYNRVVHSSGATKQLFMYVFTLYVCTLAAMNIVRLNRVRNRLATEQAALRQKSIELEAKLMESHLRILKSQVQPHFLFNTLNSISALVLSDKKELAYSAICDLGDLLRRSLNQSETLEVTLAEELTFIEKYLDIQLIRFSDRLKTNINVPDEVRFLCVPSLILQPLVENSIVHAIAKLEKEVSISITAYTEENCLILTVCDDGPGLPPDWRIEIDSGLGIKNVQDQIKSIYGSGFGLEVYNLNPLGIVNTIRLPIRTNPSSIMEIRLNDKKN